MVNEAYSFRNGSDPAFYDDSDMIECDKCGREYDYEEYRSLTCSECESELINRVVKIVENCSTCNKEVK